MDTDFLAYPWFICSFRVFSVFRGLRSGFPLPSQRAFHQPPPMTKTTPADQLWFLDSLVTIRVSASDGQDGISILEHFAPYGASPPLHFHRTEDEVFHILEGEFRVRIQDQEHRLRAGDSRLIPKGTPHTYRVESAQGGRGLAITVGGDFERFVREVSRPAERPELPPRGAPPSADAIQALRATAAKFGIEFVRPPLQ